MVSDKVDWKNAVAGQVRMDRAPGRIRVHEHAETGKPLAAYKLHFAFSGRRIFFYPPPRAVCTFNRKRWNGPAGNPGKVGHKLSAIGFPYR